MALGKDTLNNLKGGPKEDKVAVASGIAVSVVVVLLAAWAIYFFHNIQKGAQEINLSGGARDQFNFTSVTEAQQQLQAQLGNNQDQFTTIREQSQSQSGTQMQTQDAPASEEGKFNY